MALNTTVDKDVTGEKNQKIGKDDYESKNYYESSLNRLNHWQFLTFINSQIKNKLPNTYSYFGIWIYLSE